MNDDIYVSPWRVAEAQRIYQEMQAMNEAIYITDAIIAFLSSLDFFLLVALVVVGMVWKKKT